MAILKPWEQPENSSEGSVSANNCLRESERDRAGAEEYTVDQDSATSDNVVRPSRWSSRFTERDETVKSEVAPRRAPGVPARLVTVSKSFGRDAFQSAREVLDGSVYRARPSSPRDRVERWRRAQWAGDIDSLRVVGKALAVLPLVLSLLLDALRWLCTPMRFYVALAIAVTVVLIAVL